MSDTGHGHGHGHEEATYPYTPHHFHAAKQHFESGKMGVWLFLVTEILFFAGLFCAYTIYRAQHPEVFYWAHFYLDTKWGAVNTVVLILSSFTAAWAVRNAQLGQMKMLRLNILITIGCALVFMVVKAVEYTAKFEHGTLPARHFHPHEEVWEVDQFKKKHPAAAAAAERITAGLAARKGKTAAVRDEIVSDDANSLRLVPVSDAQPLTQEASGAAKETRAKAAPKAQAQAAPAASAEPKAAEPKAVQSKAAQSKEPKPSVARAASAPSAAVPVDSAAQAANGAAVPTDGSSELSAAADAAAVEPTPETGAEAGEARGQDAENSEEGSRVSTGAASVAEMADDIWLESQVRALTSEERRPLEMAGVIRKPADGPVEFARPAKAGIFFSIYFFMTGLHGLHVLIGIGLWVWMLVIASKRKMGDKYFGPIDFTALYWHLVDLIWIYLFPMLYLIH